MGTQTLDPIPELIAGGKLTVDEQERVEIGGDKVLLMLRVVVAPGVTEPAHTHPGPAIFYPLSGTGVLELDGERRQDLVAGETVHLPEGTAKAFINPADEPLVVLAVVLLDTQRPPYTVVA